MCLHFSIGRLYIVHRLYAVQFASFEYMYTGWFFGLQWWLVFVILCVCLVQRIFHRLCEKGCLIVNIPYQSCRRINVNIYICTFCQICDTYYMGILQWLYKGWLWRLWASISWWTIRVLNDKLLTASALWNKRKKKKEDFFYINIIASVDQPQICGLSNPKIFSAILQLALYDMTTQMGQMS